jgi:cytochrome c5
MNRLAPLTAVAAVLMLAACNNNKQPEVIDTNPDPMANQIANAAPVELPPAVTDSGIYRCKDNSVVYVDFLGDKTEENVRTKKGGTPVHVKAEGEGKPLTGENGFSVSGSGKAVQIAVNGGAAQTCNR